MRASVALRDQNQRPGNACGAQLREAFSHEKSSNSFRVICGRHRQVINQAAAAIVSAKHGAHHCPILFRNPAKAGIPQQVSAYFSLRIPLGYFNTLRQIPEGHRLLVVIDDEFPGKNHKRFSVSPWGHETLPECDMEIQGIR